MSAKVHKSPGKLRLTELFKPLTELLISTIKTTNSYLCNSSMY